MIQASVPDNIDPNLFQLIYLILRKAIDGTVVPLFVDNVNQRVLVGETAVVNSSAKLEVNGNLSIVGGSNGIVLPDANGTSHHCKLQAVYDPTTNLWALAATPVD